MAQVVQHPKVHYFVIETLCLQSRCNRDLNAGCVFDTIHHMKSMTHGCGDLPLKFGHHGCPTSGKSLGILKIEYTMSSTTALSKPSCPYFLFISNILCQNMKLPRAELSLQLRDRLALLAQFVLSQRSFFPMLIHMSVFCVMVFPGTTSVCQDWAVCAPVTILLIIVHVVLRIHL